MNCSSTEGFNKKVLFIQLTLFLFLVISMIASVSLGSVTVPFKTVLRALGGGEVAASIRAIVVELRVPRVLTAGLSGSALAVAGLLMQTLFGNSLAGPSVLGVSSGASLGAALALLCGAGTGFAGKFGLIGSAFLGAFLTMSMVCIVGERVRRGATLLIVGLMVGYGVSALVSILLQWAPSDKIHGFVTWSFGSFAGVGWTRLPWLALVAISGMVLSFRGRRTWDVLLLGEGCAATVGVDVRAARRIMVILSSLLAGTVTAYCGPVAFLGIAVPHMARGIIKSALHGRLILASLLLGGTVAVLSDLMARLPGGASSLPLNAVTSLIGAPVVVWVVLRSGGDR